MKIYPKIIPMIVADNTETKAPPIMVGTPSLVIKSCLLGARTHNPPSMIPIEEILAKPQSMYVDITTDF